MDRTDRFDGSEKPDHEQYEDEVAQRWGAGDAYEESMQRTRRYGKDHIDRWFYPCSHGMHRNLAEMFTADPRFADYFEKRMKGLAAFLQEAIRANEARSSHRPGSHLST